MTVFYTADLHLGHENIISHCQRPFTSVERMGDAIVDKINDRVGEDDLLWILGDITFHRAEALAEFRARLTCKNIRVIAGNHDPRTKAGRIALPLFEVFPHTFERKVVKDFLDGEIVPIVLDHYPLFEWELQQKGAYHFHGHTHGTCKHPNPKAIDVGVDCWDFKPVTLQEAVAGEILS